MTRNRNDVHATALIAEHIALDLGQRDPSLVEEWPTPDGVGGSTKSVSEISDGERLDPPQVSVHVYSGMAFYDERDDRTVTVDRTRWFAFREDETALGDSRDPTRVKFEEPEDPEDPASGPLELSGDELARRIASGRYENVTGEGVEA